MTREEFLRGAPEPHPRPGYQLLYHVTRPENAQSIVQEGLSTARAVNVGERGWIWASQKPDAFYGSAVGTLIVLQVPARGTAADLDPYNGVNWDVGSSVVILRDVLPADIVAVDPEVRTGLGTNRLSFFQDGQYAPIYWDEWFGPEAARRARSNPRRPVLTTDYARLRPDDILRVYHSTTLGDLPSLINGFDATAEHRRLYGGPRHSGIFVAPTEEAASQFGSDVMLELEVQARFLHGTDYSGNIGRASDPHEGLMRTAWVQVKYPRSFRPLLSESLGYLSEPQALLKGLVSPRAIKRVRYQKKWYSRAEFLRLSLTTNTPADPYGRYELKDAGFDLSNPGYPLSVLFAHIANMGGTEPERIEAAFLRRARGQGEDRVREWLDNIFIRGRAQDVYTRQIMQTAEAEGPIL